MVQVEWMLCGAGRGHLRQAGSVAGSRPRRRLQAKGPGMRQALEKVVGPV